MRIFFYLILTCFVSFPSLSLTAQEYLHESSKWYTVRGDFSMETIIQIDSFLFNTTYRKVFLTDQGNEIYEGIGTNLGLFAGLSSLGDEGVGILLCYSHEGVSYELNENTISDLLMTENCDEAFLITETEHLDNSAPISLYPNPVRDILWLKTPGAQNESYKIVNQLGQVVASGILYQAAEHKIDLSTLASSMYYFFIELDEQVYSRTLVKINSSN